MSDTSSPGAETHNDCVSGATFVKRFANSLEVAGSVGRSAPTDPDHFYGPLRCCGFATALDLRPLSFLANGRSFRSVLFGTGRGALHS